VTHVDKDAQTMLVKPDAPSPKVVSVCALTLNLKPMLYPKITINGHLDLLEDSKEVSKNMG
jgi:hypothetical protein